MSGEDIGCDLETGRSCKLNIIPIIPVRFSLTQNALFNTLKGAVPQMPTQVGDKDYQLRRLRQGYLYIYASIGKLIDRATDAGKESKGRWLVFQYHVSSEDSNGTLMLDMVNTIAGLIKPTLGFNETKRSGKPYHFRKYTWKNGSARDEWVLENKSYPYAFVNEQVSLIDYAYSERRWPAEMFELLEAREDFRKSTMQRVNLNEDQTVYSFPFSEISEKVADFNPDPTLKKQDMEDNYTRRTKLGFNSKHNIQISDEKDKAKARVIVVQDPIGNIADVSCLHEYFWGNLIQKQREYLYATTTARAVKSLSANLRNKSDYPVSQENLSTLNEYAAPDFLTKKYQNEITKLKNISRVHSAMMLQTGNFTILQQLKLVLNEAVKFANEDPLRINELVAYAAYLVYGLFQYLSVSHQGMEVAAACLDSEKEFGRYVEMTLKLAASLFRSGGALTKIQGLSRLELEVMYESLMSAQLYRWSSSSISGRSITRDRYLSAFGLELGYFRVNGGQDVYSEMLVQQTQLFMAERIDISQLERNSGAHHYAESSQHSNYVAVIRMDENIPDLQNRVNITSKVGIFFAFTSLFETMSNVKKTAEEDGLGDALLKTSTDLVGFVSAVLYDRNSIMSEGIANLAEAANSRLARIFGNNHILAQRFGQLTEGAGSLSSKAITVVGHVANIGSIAVSIREWINAQSKNDQMAVNAAKFALASEIAFILADLGWLGAGALATGAVALGLVFLILSLIYTYFADNEAESWVRSGFWGKSGEYWEDSRFENLDNQLNNAKILSTPNKLGYKEMNEYFIDEMNAYYNLIYGISLLNDVKSDGRLRVLCPAFTNVSSKDKLTIKLELVTAWGIQGERKEKKIQLDTSQIKKRWLYNGCIELDFSNVSKQDPDNRINDPYYKYATKLISLKFLTLSYPQLGKSDKSFVKTTQINLNEI